MGKILCSHLVRLCSLAALVFFSSGVWASDVASSRPDLTTTPLGLLALGIFILAYVLVMGEEFLHLRKSKPVILAAGAIWVIVGILVKQHGIASSELEAEISHNLHEYASLFLFLLVAMTYINAMTERNVFEVLRVWLIQKQFSFRQIFWITGCLAFFISPIADNLTTALLLGAVVLAVGSDNVKFASAACINIVVAANAGGAYSPFGDITTLMVWQSGHATFFEFFHLFIPSVVNFVIPAFFIGLTIPKMRPHTDAESVYLKRGALVICIMFIATIATAVCFEQFLHLPPFLGMMTGLSYLLFFAYYLRITSSEQDEEFTNFNIFNKVALAEWDTLFFFFGVIFCVGGLGFIGYLEVVSSLLYDGWGPTTANIAMGLMSAVVDNIPIMFAVLTMEPEMVHYQWLLITLTTGVGGSLLSIGSAAGVALMGQARGIYTFFRHLKWSWAIALGYVGSIYVHYLLNG